MVRPFQFRLRTAMAVVFGLCLLLSLLRWLGPDASIAIVLLVTTITGALLGWAFRSPRRGALFGAVLPVAYVLSIPVVEHVGHRARWPGSTWSYCSLYESLWYRERPIGSDGLWRGYYLWETWCSVMAARFDSEGPVTARTIIAALLVSGTMLWCGRCQRAALVLPTGIITSGFALATCRDFDAALIGLAVGSLAAILVNVGEKSATR